MPIHITDDSLSRWRSGYGKCLEDFEAVATVLISSPRRWSATTALASAPGRDPRTGCSGRVCWPWRQDTQQPDDRSTRG